MKRTSELFLWSAMSSGWIVIALQLEHDPEKLALGLRPDGRVAVFRKDHAQTKG
jgi:hypothetical protein